MATDEDTVTLRDLLMGQEIVGLRATTKQERDDLCWYQDGEVLRLSNGAELLVQSDPEGNGPGSLALFIGPRVLDGRLSTMKTLPGPVAAAKVWELIDNTDGIEPTLKRALLSITALWIETGHDVTDWPAVAALIVLHVPEAKRYIDAAQPI